MENAVDITASFLENEAADRITPPINPVLSPLDLAHALFTCSTFLLTFVHFVVHIATLTTKVCYNKQVILLINREKIL